MSNLTIQTKVLYVKDILSGELMKMGGGKPAVVFLVAQGVNIIWTLILAYLIFGGVLFPAPIV